MRKLTVSYRNYEQNNYDDNENNENNKKMQLKRKLFYSLIKS